MLKVDCSLKSELFRLMLKETAARMEKFEQTPESIAAAEKAKWVTTQPLTWLYQVWDPTVHAWSRSTPPSPPPFMVSPLGLDFLVSRSPQVFDMQGISPSQTGHK